MRTIKQRFGEWDENEASDFMATLGNEILPGMFARNEEIDIHTMSEDATIVVEGRAHVRRLNNLKIARIARRVARKSLPASGAPIVFFKASTGIDDLSWNSGFHLLSSWALRLKGIRGAYFACHAGMTHCVLGQIGMTSASRLPAIRAFTNPERCTPG